MNGEQKIKSLLQRYLAGKCNESERALVEQWYQIHRATDPADIPYDEIEQDLLTVGKQLPAARRQRWFFKTRYVAAATLIAATLVAYLLMVQRNGLSDSTHHPITAADIMPGGNKATLTLADGRHIVLDDISAGNAGTQRDSIVFKNEAGQLTYLSEGTQTGNKRAIPLNTITTPRGGQYRVTLPDGTQVWINAASSLTYAAIDNSGERVVQLKGEAYFEVAKSNGRPFRVITPRQTVEVMGTHFNVNSYPDEPAVKTTLLEGSVKIVGHATDEAVMLRPGQQASLNKESQLSVRQIDINDAVAWKNGLFRFENSDIEAIMRQFARWYDVEVEFEGSKPDIKLWGEAYRNASASQVLDMLAYFDLKYRIETNNSGKRKIIIYT